MSEKNEATGWVLWLVAIVVLIVLVGWALRPVDMRVDREVMVQSHQYKEGKAERIAILEANLQEVNARLATATDSALRADLEAQRAALSAQLNASRR